MNDFKKIFLIGMPGCGKSTIGKDVALRLNIPFYDVDEIIENREKQKISQIFNNGEDYFRKLESEVLLQLSKEPFGIIATGGGAIKIKKNINTIKNCGLIIFIDRPLTQIMIDIDTKSRPLLKDGKDKLIKLYEERYPLYEKYCDYKVINDTSLSKITECIINIMKNCKKSEVI